MENINTKHTDTTYIYIGRSLTLLLLAVLLAACGEDKTKPQPINTTAEDSLRKVIEQRENEVNDMFATLNEIQEGFRLISEAEGRVALADNSEGGDPTEHMKRDIRFIQRRMEENKKLIAKLQQQQRESSFRSDELKRTIENIQAQLVEKDKELNRLRTQLAEKDVHINELDNVIADLNTSVENLTEESKQKTQTIAQQEKQMHQAWYVFGTKKELRTQNILTREGVLRQNYNKGYFTQIDTRVDREIKLYSKYAKLLTNHPAGSYSLQKDANGQYVFRVVNAQQFWQTSRYLVILVK